MSIDASYQRSFTVSGQTFGTSTTVSSDASVPWNISLAVAKSGSLTTRTDNDTGTLTMASGHAITTGQRLDVYWTGGSRRGMTVGAVSVNSVPIDGGSGDNLPIATTAITAQVPTEQAVVVTGNNVQSIAVKMPNGGTVVFADASNVELDYHVLTTTLTSYVWTSADGGTNPLAGDALAKVFLSQPSLATAAIASGCVQYN